MIRQNGLVEIRLHGRGGQGVVFAGTVIAEAAHREGKFVQSFGIYGAERRGAPVTSFIRVSNQPEMPRCQISRPDIVVSFDVKLPREQVLKGLKPGGLLLLNCAREEDAWKLCNDNGFEIWRLDASGIAAEHGLGTVGIPIINTVMLGALIRVSGVSSLDSLLVVLKEKMPRKTGQNLMAAEAGYAQVRELECYATALWG
jgi:2-oxoacid:acceptor oxidoreductase gamma subunit (pyruvate/2-ketoisovalerate family)